MAILINEALLNNPIFQRYPKNQKEWNEFMLELSKGVVVDQEKVEEVETTAITAETKADQAQSDVNDLNLQVDFDFDFGL